MSQRKKQFVGDVISGVGVWLFWLRLSGTGPQLLDGIS